MIKKTIKLMMVLLLGLMLTFSNIYAANNHVSFLNKADEFIVSPASKDLFTNFKNVMPGDVLVQSLSIENDSGNKFAIKFYFKALPIAKEYRDFLSQMLMTLKNDDKVFYRDTIDKTMALEEYILLANLKPGEYINLDVTLEVPISLSNEHADLLGQLEWEFMVEEIVLPPEVLPHEPTPPTTGINANTLPYLILIGISASLFVFSKRKLKA